MQRLQGFACPSRELGGRCYSIMSLSPSQVKPWQNVSKLIDRRGADRIIVRGGDLLSRVGKDEHEHVCVWWRERFVRRDFFFFLFSTFSSGACSRTLVSRSLPSFSWMRTLICWVGGLASFHSLRVACPLARLPAGTTDAIAVGTAAEQTGTPWNFSVFLLLFFFYFPTSLTASLHPHFRVLCVLHFLVSLLVH